ncbi:uncharacterized protein PG986_008937 [Apiospora aurea]|uniref:Uncharacterized protein n=1 Tax=Apiospora aurea TaxID=335848 RepID=A0ABR1Q671_9PEZI
MPLSLSGLEGAKWCGKTARLDPSQSCKPYSTSTTFQPVGRGARGFNTGRIFQLTMMKTDLIMTFKVK